MKVYAGVGSRETPTEIIEFIDRVAERLAADGWTVRSGHAPGADLAFEYGGMPAEVYLPWPSFNADDPVAGDIVLDRPAPSAVAYAQQYHPAWDRLNDAERKLMARTSHVLLGKAFTQRVSFVLCWTPKGRADGGTGQAIRVARGYGIPVFNLGLVEHYERVERWAMERVA